MQPTLLVRLRGRSEITMVVLTVGACTFALLQSLIIPVLAPIQDEYDTSQTTVTWVLTAYLLSASVSTPLLGRLGDTIGKTRVLVGVLLALALGSLVAAIAPSIGWLIAARVVQGLGGGVLPLSFGIIRDQFRERMTLAVSVVASVAAVGFGAGIVVAGPIVDTFGYRGLFWLPMIFTTAAAAAAALLVRDGAPPAGARVPLLPALLLAGWLVALLLGLTQGNLWGWGSGKVVSLFVAAVALGALWVATELRAEVPLIDMRMIRRRGVWTSNVVAGSLGFSSFASLGFLPQLLQTPPDAGYGFGASISESGHMLLPAAAGNFVVGFLTAPLCKRLGARFVVTSGLVAAAVAMLTIALFHDAEWQLYVATSLQGIGQGLVYSSMIGVVVASVPRHQTGVASGMNANIRTIGGSIGSTVLAGILAAHAMGSGHPSERGYQIGFIILAAVLIAATGAALLMPHVGRHPAESNRLSDAADAELGLIAGAPPSSVA